MLITIKQPFLSGKNGRRAELHTAKLRSWQTNASVALRSLGLSTTKAGNAATLAVRFEAHKGGDESRS